MAEQHPAAFDAFAAAYDDDFTHTTLGRLLRPRVWEVLARYFPAGSHVLELACGTGEDALWLAGRGVRVTATDGAAEMVRVAQAKVARAGVATAVTVRQCSLQAIAYRPEQLGPPATFDGAFSNFGGLNTLSEWQPLAEALGQLVRPGGVLVLVPMGPFCPWEIGWHLLHGQWRVAFRRFGGPAPAVIGNTTIPIWYPSARQLRREFGPWFRPVSTSSLGLWLPPSYLEHLAVRRPGLFTRLARLERRTAHLTGGWGDHYVLVLQRR